MGFIKETFAYISEHYLAFFAFLGILYIVLEMITSFTPTKKDDMLLERTAKVVRAIKEKLGIPNLKKEVDEKGNVTVSNHPKRSVSAE